MTDSPHKKFELLSATKLTVFVGGDERFEHHPLHQRVMNLLGQMGIKRAIINKGFMSYGSRRHIHSALNEVTMGNLPVIIEAIDEREKIDRAADQLVELMGGHGLIQIQATTITELRNGEGNTR